MKVTVTILSIYSVAATVLILLLHFQVQELKLVLPAPQASMHSNQVFQFNTEAAPKSGAHHAPIEIVVFSDFQCRVCSDASKALNQVMIENPGKIRRVFKHLPLSYHPHAVSAACAAMAAHVQGKFWEMHDALMAADELGYETYIKSASEIGLDITQFQKDLGLENWEDYLQNDMNEAFVAQAPGAPTYYVNGHRVEGISYTQLKRTLITMFPEHFN